jgi:hypothetical protein
VQIKGKSRFLKALEIPILFTCLIKLRPVKIQLIDNQRMIWDPCRKKYVPHTPEEYVRQSAIEILHQHYNYPLNKMAVEREFHINGRKKRFDLLLFNSGNEPFVLIECKAPEVSLDQSVIDQISRYHFVVKAPFLAVTNGKNMLVSGLTRSGEWKSYTDLPPYS